MIMQISVEILSFEIDSNEECYMEVTDEVNKALERLHITSDNLVEIKTNTNYMYELEDSDFAATDCPTRYVITIVYKQELVK